MPKTEVAIDYTRCDPQKCENGICIAALECEYGSLVQPEAYEMPELNPARWCRGCAKCALVCPQKAIKMM